VDITSTYKVVWNEGEELAPVQRILFKQEINPAMPNRTPLCDPNIEGAIGQMLAPHQTGESDRSYNRHMQAKPWLVDHQAPPTFEVQSTTMKTQSLHAGLYNPAFAQSKVRGHLTQVKIEAPLMEQFVPCSEEWADRVAHQRLCNKDLYQKGASDQGGGGMKILNIEWEGGGGRFRP